MDKLLIEKVTEYSRNLLDSINDLLRQLNPTALKLSKDDINIIVHSDSSNLFVAKDTRKRKIVGMLTLVIYRIPVWKKGWIEDLVVDKSYRGRGIAARLIERAVDAAKKKSVLSLNLTSSPNRKFANRLYERLGFEKRSTNVYRIKI